MTLPGIPNEFATQFAIRLPSGELLRTPTTPSWMSAFLPNSAGMRDREGSVVIYDTLIEAQDALELIRATCARYGVTLTASIEQRLCSPFTMTDPAAQFADEIEKWAGQQGGGE